MHSWLTLLLLMTPSHFASHLAETAKHASVKAPHDTPAAPRGRFTYVESETVHTGAPFEPRIISRLVRSRSSALQACYERALRASPTPFAGRIVLSLTITPEGSASNVRVVANGTGDEMTASCATRVVQGFRFNPGPEGDAHFTVTFEFRPQSA